MTPSGHVLLTNDDGFDAPGIAALAEAAARVAAQPGLYSAGALATHHPTPAEVVPMWEAMFERVLTRARRA